MNSGELYYEDIIELIDKNSHVNYVAFASMKHHIAGVKASLNYLNDRGIIPRGFVFIGKHSKTGKHIYKSDFLNYMNRFEIDVLDVKNEFRNKLDVLDKIRVHLSVEKIRPNNRVIYLIGVTPSYAISYFLNMKNISTVFITIDDGTVSYFNPYMLNMLYMEMSGNANRFLLHGFFRVKRIVSTFLNEHHNKILKKNGYLIDFRIYKNTGNTLLINDYAKYYKEAYKDNNKDSFREFYSCVLFNTQCFSENNFTDGNVDFDIYKTAIQIVKKYFDHILIKPHPREKDYSKYTSLGCSVYKDGTYSQEEILASIPIENEPKCIISISSSTMRNALGIFNIPSISLAKLALKENLSDTMKLHTRNFVKGNEKIMLLPETWEEFEELIQRFI